MKTAIGVDIGGTNLVAGLVREDGKLLNVGREQTPPGGEAALELLVSMVADVYCTTKAQASPPVGIGLSFGGPVDFAAQAIVRSHHVEGWAPGLKLADLFAAEFRTRVVVENDANCGGLGEAVFGASRGYASSLYVNIGTGIGGAIILGGRVHHGANSTAGELGHCVVVPGGPLCTCDKHGCLEALSSGSALARAGREAGLGEGITGKEVGESALDGDPVALRVVAEAGGWLGVALGNACNLFDPHLIVVGGGVAGLGEPYLGPAREAFAATAMPAAAGTPLVVAQLGYEAGVVGAAALVLSAAG